MTDRQSAAPAGLARLSGLGYLVIIVAGIFAEFFVRGGLIVPGDGPATLAAIRGAETLYRSSLASEFLMLVSDVMLAGALYLLFRAVSRPLALIAATFRLTHAAIVGANLLNAYLPLLLLHGADTPAGALRAESLTLVYLDAHAYGYAVGLVFFGVHCLLLGTLILRATGVPRLLGALLLLAGLGYLVDSLGRTLLVDYAASAGLFQTLVFVPAFVGELSFCLWLLIRGDRGRPRPRVQAAV
ncbi:MAG: DUF4386 domain-containing protein [Candidatus Krumholzibacteriia bacterium]|nr:DUF4386 domain-containing protein [Candidatus Latescibacterota bacterium]